MIGIKKFDTLANVFPPGNFFNAAGNKYVLLFCIFWLLVAFLELGQDYISAMVNDRSFVLVDSLSYKLFWPLFIPFSILLDFSTTRLNRLTSGIPYLATVSIMVILITTLHLIIFSLILFGVSNLIHENPMTLLYLLFEKLSTRLYIALTIYFALALLFLLIRRSRSQTADDQKIAPKAITVKNGKSTAVVNISDIKWIGSDGGYLDIYTSERKYVLLDSLKNMIERLPENFKRIHRSTIVNIDRIVELKSRGNGDYDVIMEDEMVLRLSRNYANQLRGILL